MLDYRVSESSVPSKQHLQNDFEPEVIEVVEIIGSSDAGKAWTNNADLVAFILGVSKIFSSSPSSYASITPELLLFCGTRPSVATVRYGYAVNPSCKLADYHRALLNEPVLDGFDHPGSAILARHIANDPELTRSLLSEILGNSSRISEAADTIRLLSRLKPFDARWRQSVVRLALLSPSLAIRDAAMQAVESWAEFELLELLKQHPESDAWLANYARQIIADHSG